MPIYTDDFGRADTTAGLGTTETGGGTWSYVASTAPWGISSGQAHKVADLTNGFALVSPGESDGVLQVTVPVLGSSPGNPGPVFRYVDSNNYWWVDVSPSGGLGTLIKNVANFTTDVATFATDTGSHLWRVELDGPDIVVKKDGVTVASVTDTDLQAATKHGMYAFRAVTLFDGFSWTGQPVVIPPPPDTIPTGEGGNLWPLRARQRPPRGLAARGDR